MTVLTAGQKIADRYQLDHRIAVGGMGEVWEASDMRLGRSVAVKVLRPELSDDPEFLHRFRIEARTVASLDHNGIAAVHDYGEDEARNGRRTAYLVMELVRGDPLSTLIARGPIETDETLRLIEEAAWALQAAHERGFVHRDVKPGNILVRTDGLVKLTDFGIAKAADAVPVTRSGMVMGTAHYIAPEQASGSEAGPAGDVYSLGIVGYECLAGHRPFRAESAVAVAMMQVRDEPPPLPTTVPAEARALIEAVLVKDPTQRYATGGEFALAVAAIRRGEPLPPPAAISGETPIIPSRPPATPARPRPAVTVTPPSAPVAAPTSDSYAATPYSADQHGADQYGIDQYGADQYGVDQYAAASSDAYAGARQEHRRPPARQASRRAAAERSGSALPTEPLRLQPNASGRTLLLVLFVLLTLAAVAVGIVVFGGLRADGGPLVPAPLSAGAGTVLGWEGVSAGSAVPGGPLSSAIITGSVR